VIEVIKAAATLGAVVANYCAVEDFLFDGELIDGVIARDQLTGDVIEVRGGSWSTPPVRGWMPSACSASPRISRGCG
jgi:hypothetical protein